MPLKRGDPRHGTVNGYTNHECRCKRCRTAWADFCREKRYSNRVEGGVLKSKYALAREAGYTPDEARRRAHWADPLAPAKKKKRAKR